MAAFPVVIALATLLVTSCVQPGDTVEDPSEILPSEPWADGLSPDDIRQIAESRSYQHFDQNAALPQGVEVSLVFETEPDQDLRSSVQAALDTTVNAMPRVFDSTVVVFVGSSLDFALTEANALTVTLPPNKQGTPFEDWAPERYGQGGLEREVWPYQNFVWIGQETLDVSSAGYGIVDAGASILGGYSMFDPPPFPPWFVFGTSGYLGMAISHWDKGESVEHPPLSWEDAVDLRQDSWYSDDISEYESTLAVEYLIANIGVDGLYAIYSSSAGGLPFEDSFAEATGITTSDFYDHFYAVHLPGQD